QPDHLPVRQDVRRAGQFVVAVDGDHRGDAAELVQHGQLAHVARVQDQVDSGQRVEDRLRQGPAAIGQVRVGDQTECRAHGLAPPGAAGIIQAYPLRRWTPHARTRRLPYAPNAVHYSQGGHHAQERRMPKLSDFELRTLPGLWRWADDAPRRMAFRAG